VTKADVISAISDQTGVPKSDVSQSIEGFFSVVKAALESGEAVYVRGFGSFVNKKRAQKVARNISKNTSLVIAAHQVPSFKPAKTFVEDVKAKTEGK
jgi:DNA-binding protein HU-beta